MMKRILLLTMTLLALVVGRTMADIVISPDGNGIIYVKVDGTGNGSSWDEAANLPDALKGAPSGSEIWVAEGKYTPRDKAAEKIIGADAEDPKIANDRDRSFLISKGIAVYGGFAGKETTRDERDWQENVTILSGDLAGDDDGTEKKYAENAYHVVIIALQNEEKATLDGFTITAGRADATKRIQLDLGYTQIERHTGGGVYANAGATLSHNTICDNTAYSKGGGIKCFGSTIVRNTICKNKVTFDGGGIEVSGGTLSQNTIYGNTAGRNGGGGEIYGTIIVSQNTFYDNKAENGGGVYVTKGTVSQNTFYNNTATDKGDGVYVKNTTTDIGNGVLEASVDLNHNIIWGNSEEDLYINNAMGDPAIAYNLIGSLAQQTTRDIDDTNRVDPDLDPLFEKIDTESDPKVYDFRLTFTSPAIGMGEGGKDLGAFSYLLNADKSGIIYVDKNVTGGTGDGSSWENARTDLSDALLNNAAKKGIREIWVAAGTYTPKYIAGNGTTARDRSFVIPAGVAVYGGFAAGETSLDARDLVKNETILSGEIGEEGRVENCYHVVIVPLPGEETAILDGFTISGGRADGSGTINVNGVSVTQNYGGGVWVYGNNTLNRNTISNNKANKGGGGIYSCYATLTHNVIQNNRADKDAFSTGGGVFAYEGVLSDNTLSENISSNGGGVYIYASTVLTNNTIKNNTGSNGGGVYTGNLATLTNNTIYGNNGGTGGGVYVNSNGTDKDATLTNNTIYNNTCTGIGSGVYTSGAILNNNIIWGNTGGDDLRLSYPNVVLHNLIGTTNKAVSEDNLIGIDPGFTNAEAFDFSLLATSPAINKGSNAAYLTTYPSTDLAGNDRFKGGTIDIGAYEYQSADEIYHTISLIIGEGIDCNYMTGDHTIAEGDHLFLTFYAENPELTAEEILFLIDGVETAFKTSIDGKGGSYILNPIEKDQLIEIRLREGAIDPNPNPDPTGNLDLAEGKIQITMNNGQWTIDNKMTTAVDVSVYDITGKSVVLLRGLQGSRIITLPAGIYIVRAGQQTWKIIVNN